MICDADLANGAIVEDMQLGTELATKGYETHFCPDAVVRSSFPVAKKDMGTQRRRWEHGHLEMIMSQSPRLLLAALCQRSWGLLFLVLDLMVPPIALHCLILILGLMITACAALWLSVLPFLVLLAGALIFGLTLLFAWFGFARHVISWRELLGIPMYMFSKVSMYLGFIHSRESRWVRTGRNSDD